jgi:hypothetical protein
LQESADHRRLPILLEEEAIVPVRRIDHVTFHVLPEQAERGFDLTRTRGRIQPIGAESDQKRPGLEPGQRALQRTVAVLPGEIEVRERPRGIEVCICVEAADKRRSLVTEVALDLELRFAERVAMSSENCSRRPNFSASPGAERYVM